MNTFKKTTTTEWRQFVLKVAFRLMDEEYLSDEIILTNFRGDSVGHMVFNGGIYNYDNSVFDKKMDAIYVNDFKPFLATLNIDKVDMYIYIR